MLLTAYLYFDLYRFCSLNILFSLNSNDFILETQETEFEDIQEPASTEELYQHQRKLPKKRGELRKVKQIDGTPNL